MPRLVVTVDAEHSRDIREGLKLAHDQIFYTSLDGWEEMRPVGNITITSPHEHPKIVKNIIVAWRVEDGTD